MDVLKYEKGVFVEVISWENDGDNYNTVTQYYPSVMDAKQMQKACLHFAKSEGDLQDADDQKFLDFRDKDKYFNDLYSPEEIREVIEDIVENLVGTTDGGLNRVCESCKVFIVREDVYFDEVRYDA